ncbi:MAG: hypothetical protein ABIN01_06245 [Ferruginibacter sp.]
MKNISLKFAFLFLLSISFNSSYSQKNASTSNFTVEEDTKMVRVLLKKIDADISDTSIYADDVVHMAQGSRAITNKAELSKVLKAELSYGHSEMAHEIVTLQSYHDMVLTRGRVKGTYHPNNGGKDIPFETNNIIIFKRMKDRTLKVGQVIFNRVNLETLEKPKTPFNKFIGEWTLKDDNWSQNWGQGDEHIKIPNHHTICRELNTDNSLLAVIDGTPPYGHIFWSYNPVKKEVNHLSSFGTIRAGVGKGTLNENGDVSLKISFADEPEGTYRLYTYKWISENEYDLKSIQYDAKDKPTGNFYGGTFVRIKQSKK